MAERITSVMVAEVAGVSQAAVSRVFTPGASVSKKTAEKVRSCLLYTSPSPRDRQKSRMPSSA